MGDKISLKKAKKKDFKQIAKVYSDSFREYPYNEPWTVKKAIRKLKIFNKYCDIWKIIYNKELGGFVIVNPNAYCPGEVAFGEEMAIKSDYRGKGIGREVLKKVMDIYKKRGFETFMGIANKDSKAFKLWKKLGITESKDYVLIEKELNNKKTKK